MRAPPWRTAAVVVLATMTLVGCSNATRRPSRSLGTSTSTPVVTASPTPPAATAAELTTLGEQMVPRQPRYGYYVSCVNFKENGAWPPPTSPVDYSACPITDELRDRMQSTRADFLNLQNPASGRNVSVTPRPGGGVIVVTLTYAPAVKLELVAVRVGDRFLVGDVVAEGDVTGPSSTPISFAEKPLASFSPAPRATTSAGSRILPVPWYRQVFTLSCEEASLRMALAFEGITTTDAAILAIIGTDQQPAYVRDGVMHWGDPYRTFVGNPNGSEVALTGYGTYYPTIAHAARALGGRVLRSGEGIAAASIYEAILAGHPAVVWITHRWVTAQRNDYIAFDGRRIPYAGPVEHAVTAVGVDRTRVLINDPAVGAGWVAKGTFEASYATYGQMAVILA